MSQVNKYADRAAFAADNQRLSSKSAVSFIESERAMRYEGVNILVDRPAAAVGDLAVYDRTAGAIRFLKSATLDPEQLPQSLTPLAVVYARQGDRLRVVSLENAASSIRWGHTYEAALSGFDLAAGGTFVLTFGAGSSQAADVPVMYAAGATLADVAAAIAAALKGGTPNYSLVEYGGWGATATDDLVVMGSNTFDDTYAKIAVASGCRIAYTPENANYQTASAGLLIEGHAEYVRRRNGVIITSAGCNTRRFVQYYSVRGADTTGIEPGSETIVRQSAFTEADNPALAAAYPTYPDYLLGEHLLEYPSVYSAMLRDGKANTAKIGAQRFVDIHGRSAPCYPAAAAALDYGIGVEGAATGLEAGAWWLPSVDEIYLLMHDRVLSPADREQDPVNRTLSRLERETCYGDGYYPWTSCECLINSSYFYNGYLGDISRSLKCNANPLRPVSVL
ncbi:hypothetical protein [Alistipes sp.]|uniref:hypothetical protein n=1 Tax=Alistipes sp. TaxID=1872444 RepID=UPI003AF12B39